MNFDEMSEEACRDYLAERRRWTTAVLYRTANLVWREKDCPNSTHTGDPTQWQHEHPIPATIDEAAKLPEGWFLSGPAIYVDNIKQEIHATAWNGINADCCSRGIASTRGENAELLARFRLRCRVESLTVRAEIN